MQKWISSGWFPKVLKGFHSHEVIDFLQDNRPGGEAGRDARQEEGAAGLCCGVCHRRQSSRQEDLWPLVPSRQVSFSTLFLETFHKEHFHPVVGHTMKSSTPHESLV